MKDYDPFQGASKEWIEKCERWRREVAAKRQKRKQRRQWFEAHRMDFVLGLLSGIWLVDLIIVVVLILK